MKDGFNRNVDYLKISLQNECDLRCFYCINEDEKILKRNLSVDDYKFIMRSLAKMGINKVEFSGGEPLLNESLCELIHYAKYVCNMETVSLTTNGIKFFEKANELRAAGLDIINIGVNSLKEYRYKTITRGGSLNDVLKSFEVATRLGIKVNLNCIVIDKFNNDEINDFIELINNFYIDLIFYELMPVGKSKNIFDDGYFDIRRFIDSMDGLTKVYADGQICKEYYRFNNSKGKIGIVSILDSYSCEGCNKMFITNDGRLKLCAYSNEEYDITQFLYKPLTFAEVMKDVILNKPENFNQIKRNLTTREIYEI